MDTLDMELEAHIARELQWLNDTSLDDIEMEIGGAIEIRNAIEDMRFAGSGSRPASWFAPVDCDNLDVIRTADGEYQIIQTVRGDEGAAQDVVLAQGSHHKMMRVVSDWNFETHERMDEASRLGSRLAGFGLRLEYDEEPGHFVVTDPNDDNHAYVDGGTLEDVREHVHLREEAHLLGWSVENTGFGYALVDGSGNTVFPGDLSELGAYLDDGERPMDQDTWDPRPTAQGKAFGSLASVKDSFERKTEYEPDRAPSFGR